MSDTQDRLIRLPEVIRRTSKSRSAIYVAMANGEFPKSVKLGPLSVAWVESEIDEWLEQMISARDSKAA